MSLSQFKHNLTRGKDFSDVGRDSTYVESLHWLLKQGSIRWESPNFRASLLPGYSYHGGGYPWDTRAAQRCSLLDLTPIAVQ